MNTFFVVAVLLLSCSTAQCQSLQTMYYEGGAKAIEGRWTLYSNAALSTNYTETSYKRSSGPTSLNVLPLPDLIAERDWIDIHLLSMKCEGLITTWYADGVKKSALTFVDGMPSGMYHKWYPNGRLAMQGWLVAGMPSGAWETFWDNGKQYFRGSFLPCSQAALQQRWETLYYSNDKRFRYDYYRLSKVAEEAFDTLQTAAARETEWLRHSFRQFSPEVIGTKQGLFRFWRKDGSKWAEVSFRDNVRTGKWITWDSTGLVQQELTYEAGRLLAIRTSAGKKTPDQYITWQRQRSERVQVAVEMPAAVPEVTYKVVQHAYFNGVSDYFKRTLPVAGSKLMKRLSQDTAVVEVYITTDGAVSHEQLIKGIRPDFDRALLQAVRGMPRWHPAKENGVAVGEMRTLTFQYSLAVWQPEAH